MNDDLEQLLRSLRLEHHLGPHRLVQALDHQTSALLIGLNSQAEANIRAAS